MELVLVYSVLALFGLVVLVARAGAGRARPVPIVLHYPAVGPSPVALGCVVVRV